MPKRDKTPSDPVRNTPQKVAKQISKKSPKPSITSIKPSTAQAMSDEKKKKLDIARAKEKAKESTTKSSKKSSPIYLVPVKPLPSGAEYLKLDLDSVRSSAFLNELGPDQQTGPHHADFPFQDGFVVDEDQIPIAPYTWGVATNKIGARTGTRSQAASFPLVFSLLADLSDANAPLKNKIAIVREKKPDETEPPEQEYSYKLFTYGDANQKSGLKYVVSGSNQSVIPGGHVISNTFIPLDILRTRLCGSWEARQEAYTRDWLTFCNVTIQLELRRPVKSQRNMKDLIPDEALPKNWKTEQVLRNLASWTGSHLQARDSAGNLSADLGAKFLYHLLMPSQGDSLRPQDLSQYIFKRWCLIANSAASIEKEPFSVKSRFWKIPKALTVGDDFELIYEMLPGWWDNANNTILRDKRLSSKLKLVLKNNAFKFDLANKTALDALWKQFMESVFTQTASSTPPLRIAGKTVPVVKGRLLSPKDKSVDLFELGSHPQGYYRTYIRKRDLKRMSDLGYTLNCIPHPFPNKMSPDKIVLNSGLKHTIDSRGYPETNTLITKTYMKIAGNCPRVRTQNAVMGDVSANDIAARIWPKEKLGRRPAEWLHRSAYSYGGSGRPDDSQEQENLVFGTFETNTEMIRYEAYLKRMVNMVPEHQTLGPFSVALTTALNTSNSQLGRKGQSLPWLVTQLGYEWSFDLNYAFNSELLASTEPTNRQIKNWVIFDLFSQSYPMLYEVDVDAIFDAELSRASDYLKAVVALFLITRPAGPVQATSKLMTQNFPTNSSRPFKL